MSTDLQSAHPRLREAVEQVVLTHTKKINAEKLLPYVVKALPILVSVAMDNERIGVTYKQLAEKIGGGGPRHANRPFAVIGEVLKSLEKIGRFEAGRFLI